jgi:hypothetical protein
LVKESAGAAESARAQSFRLQIWELSFYVDLESLANSRKAVVLELGRNVDLGGTMPSLLVWDGSSAHGSVTIELGCA